MATDKFKQKALEWQQRVIQEQRDVINNLKVLVMTGVHDEETLEIELGRLLELESVDYDNLGFVGFVKRIEDLSQKSLDHYPTMKVLYEQEYNEYLTSGVWEPKLVKDVASYYLRAFKNRDIELRELDNIDSTRGMSISMEGIYSTLKEQELLKEIELTKGQRNTLILKTMQEIINQTNKEGFHIAMIEVKTTSEEQGLTNMKLPIVKMFKKYKIEIGNAAKIFISRRHIRIPDLYLPRNEDARVEFLQIYREVGFDNEFYNENELVEDRDKNKGFHKWRS